MRLLLFIVAQFFFACLCEGMPEAPKAEPEDAGAEGGGGPLSRIAGGWGALETKIGKGPARGSAAAVLLGLLLLLTYKWTTSGKVPKRRRRRRRRSSSSSSSSYTD